MNWDTPEGRRLIFSNPDLAARIAHWESCGLYVRMYLFALRLKLVQADAGERGQ